MDVYAAISKRRSIRSFRGNPIPDEILTKLLNAMRLAPSGSNRQPWKFIVVKDAATRKKLANTYHAKNGSRRNNVFVQDHFAVAPVHIIACSSERDAVIIHRGDDEPTLYYDWQKLMSETDGKPGSYESCHLWDLSIALTHLTLAAVEEGLGTCWIAALAEGEVKEILSIPENIRAPFMMVVGYPTEWPATPSSRKPLEEVVCYETYE